MNRRMSLCVVAVLSAASLVAAVKAPKPKTVAERRAEKAAEAAKRMQEDGGEAIRPGTMKGHLLIANAQKLVDPFEIEEIRDFLWDQLNFRIEIRESKPVNPTTVVEALRTSGAGCGVFLVEDPSLPILLLAPEDHWAIVNCTRLAEGAKTQKYVDMRVKKELVRAFSLVCSGGSSTHAGSMFGAIKTASDLDGFPAIEIPFDILDRFNHYLKPLGVTPAERMPYASAVYESWCPAPTNKWQKLIWDQAHTPPTKPIKITYDKDKQKPVVK